jgi:hypothetical protein
VGALETLNALARLVPLLAPGAHGELLTTKAMAERLGISPKTLLKRKASGEIHPAVQIGARGVAAIRWRGDEMPSGNGMAMRAVSRHDTSACHCLSRAGPRP